MEMEGFRLKRRSGLGLVLGRWVGWGWLEAGLCGRRELSYSAL